MKGFFQIHRSERKFLAYHFKFLLHLSSVTLPFTKPNCVSSVYICCLILCLETLSTSFIPCSSNLISLCQPRSIVSPFRATVCKMVRPMLSDRCPVCLCLSVLSVCDVGVLWPNGWMDPDETWHAGTPRPWPHCVTRGPSSPPPKGHSPQFSAHTRFGQMAE